MDTTELTERTVPDSRPEPGLSRRDSTAPAASETIRAGASPSPRIYYFHPLQAGPLAAWEDHLDRAVMLGFDHVLFAPPFVAGPTGSLLLSADVERLDQRLGFDGYAIDGLARIAGLCRARGLVPLLDVVTDRVALGSPLAASAGGLYAEPAHGGALDPRGDVRGRAAATAATGDAAALGSFWAAHLARWAEAGFAGFRLVTPATSDDSPMFVRNLATAVRRGAPGMKILAWTCGMPLPEVARFAGCGLDAVFSSLPWWDFRDGWFWQEADLLRRIAPVIAPVEAPFGPRLAASTHDAAHIQAHCERAIGFATAIGAGWMMPMGCEHAALHRLDPARDTPDVFAAEADGAAFSLATPIMAGNRDAHDAPAAHGDLRLLAAPGAPVIALLRADAPDARCAKTATLVLMNTDITRRQSIGTAGLMGNAGGPFLPVIPGGTIELSPGEIRRETAVAAAPILLPEGDLTANASTAAAAARVAIEAVTPAVDDGRFPVRRVLGDVVQVEADIICEGHDVLGVALLWRAVGSDVWHEERMRPLVNDRFAGSFPLTQIGSYEFTVEAWRDEFATYRSEIAKKHAAGVEISLELREGEVLLDRIAGASTAMQTGAVRQEMQALCERYAAATPEERLALILADTTGELMVRADPRPFAVRIVPAFPLDCERSTARFASWYEIFPRSMSDDPDRHGTFDDVIRHLPRIRDMGFDVLYFPPIHPIGRANRKGRNNTLTPSDTDPGSPYAIGSDAGGHTAVHPELGTLEDFRRLVAAAGDHGLELALDFAVQCAPDHPWLKQHKRWFDWRPDGTIKYAENPPKKYQDIVNVDFYGKEAIPELWVELCSVVLFWVEQGVKIFRVDNPHTKPLPFWQYLIGEVKARHPDTMFLAEAFTKPKMMYRLAKIGFSQSYTYFTWRDTRAELTSYLEELTTTAPREFFRPNFFVNTPDINPTFLQHNGRSGFLIRAALATTLGGLWGVYSGFELCEAAALPGREEYADAEKYEIKAWDWERPGNIVREITALNWARRTNPALQTHLGVTFLGGPNPSIITYEKATPDRGNVVFVAVNLDPWRVQETDVELPLWRWSLPDHGTLGVDDLVTGTRFTLQGKYQHLRLDPQISPYAIWRLAPAIA